MQMMMNNGGGCSGDDDVTDLSTYDADDLTTHVGNGGEEKGLYHS